MAAIIEMPKLSDTMEEGTISQWNIKEGDTVQPGDIVAEVETDKATMELEAFDGGTVLKILVEEGVAVPLGEKLVILGEPGEDISKLGDTEDASKKKDASETEKPAPQKTKEGAGGVADEDKETEEESSTGRIKVSPLARKMAKERGIDLNLVTGSGPDGRIIKSDIENFKEKETKKDTTPSQKKSQIQPPALAETRSRETERIVVSQMRKTIGKRLSESKFSSPHFYETIDIDMKKAIEVRSKLNEISDVKISFNDLVVKACATALRQHPWVNASWMGDVIQLHGDVNVAVAVAVEEGLLTPVIRYTDQKGLREISIETKDFAARARDKKLQPEDWEGSTFTVSNLGMYGIEEFTAIINPPNASILAIGAIRDVPVVEDGLVVPGKRMKVTLSSDHRIVDGARAAEFLNSIRTYLENPATMLL